MKKTTDTRHKIPKIGINTTNKIHRLVKHLKNDIKRRKIVGKAILLVIILFVFNFFTGWVSYSAAIITCGRLPVTASKFAAGYEFHEFGEPSYGPDMFASYYCTARDALNAGYHK